MFSLEAWLVGRPAGGGDGGAAAAGRAGVWLLFESLSSISRGGSFVKLTCFEVRRRTEPSSIRILYDRYCRTYEISPFRQSDVLSYFILTVWPTVNFVFCKPVVVVGLFPFRCC